MFVFSLKRFLIRIWTLFLQLRGSLDALLNQLKNFPARLKQYSSYEHVQKLLKGYMKVWIIWNIFWKQDYSTIPIKFCLVSSYIVLLEVIIYCTIQYFTQTPEKIPLSMVNTNKATIPLII